MTKEKIQISFNEIQLKKLREVSRNQGESIANIVRLAVNEFFLRLEGAV